nr:MAG TPA: hypothetical protein [Caudoviricetes sp.]
MFGRWFYNFNHFFSLLQVEFLLDFLRTMMYDTHIS